ncbi:Uncharacterized conserved protein YkwD, contains CAP (CSP/antigen 5/PR1) domain [Chitinophaga costaii]|uniref:Uncharacterized conserved protein YkwD, contains CAP (CSP/antigen 5/PR1) domain n=1 Tax=Chitinophaga costaii TaxID=1335309 RepID=A0A1C4CEJ4_9BACT|nr:CAP domain-containing protein [Chitinophaga costaii]PUZ27122.1 CAP domain-containing protein [Chitinophaga costaii]SCC17443.1 Uncharacterized conserved protein YkwD, contains CAP (CSP/antigen 5/PR1) domain [Chitinophaga costaii]
MKTHHLIALFAAVVVTGSPAAACSRGAMPPAKTTVKTARTDAATLNAQILFYVNKYRSSKGLPPLQANKLMDSLAEMHSQQMADGITPFGHDGFEDRVATYSKLKGRVSAAAENVAYGNLDAEGVVNGWIHSPGHRKNMEGKYNLSGIGTAPGKGGVIYFTQLFINQ